MALGAAQLEAEAERWASYDAGTSSFDAAVWAIGAPVAPHFSARVAATTARSTNVTQTDVARLYGHGVDQLSPWYALSAGAEPVSWSTVSDAVCLSRGAASVVTHAAFEDTGAVTEATVTVAGIAPSHCGKLPCHGHHRAVLTVPALRLMQARTMSCGSGSFVPPSGLRWAPRRPPPPPSG